MYRFIPVAFLSAISLAAQNPPVPETYQDIYSLLTTQISSFDSAVKSGWNGTSSNVLYAPQLQSASSESYLSLLGPDQYTYHVLPELEHLKALGATAVTVHIDFPILYQPFYVSNPSQYQSFLDFYQQLVLDIHSRGLKMCVESSVGPAFTDNEAGAFTAFFKSLSWNAYMTGRATNAANVAQFVKPDYMSVITEPDTEATSSYQTNAGTVSGSTQLLNTILATVKAAGPSNVKIGAGAGTWINSFPQYVENFSATSIDYVDTHVYPINNNDLMVLLSAATTVQAAGKGMAISEAWEYKVRNDELGVLSITELYGRDPFSFWAPVDGQFLSALSDFANSKGLLFISPFWTQYFSTYLDYNEYGSDPATTVLSDAFTAAANDLEIGTTSPSAMTWLNRVIPAPDKTPPAVPSAPIVENAYPNSIQLSWLPTTDNVGVNAYQLYRNGALLATTTLFSYADQNLVPGETYTYALTASDASGNVSAQSAPTSVETLDTTPPSIPTGFKVTGTTDKSVVLSWNASTGIGGVGGYWILRGSSPTTMSIHSGTTTTSFTDHNSPSTTYYYAVESYNPLEVASKPGPTIEVTTPAK